MHIAACCIVLLSSTVALVTTVSRSAGKQVVPDYGVGVWSANFSAASLEAKMRTDVQVELHITNIDTTQLNYQFRLESANPHLAIVDRIIPASEIDVTTRSWRGNVTVRALFLGETKITVERVNTLTNATETCQNQNCFVAVVIVRQMRIIDHIFTGSVVLLVSLLYINFGAALDTSVLYDNVRRPTGPAIGFLTQILLMPVLSYGLGILIFPNAPEMQLGLFFTGVSPSGGASNIWTVVLGGNITLSVLMTTISNLAAFIVMPVWIFSLGQKIFERGNMNVPYSTIGTYMIALIVPLAIGLGIQKWSPRLTRTLVRLLKPVAMCLILFIIVFAIATNLYLFELFSWQIVVAGIALPWLGYIFAWIVAKLFRQNPADALTIAIETGIQNTGIAIFMLKSLPQPQADLTTVIPVSVAIMTPLPLLALYLSKRFRRIKYGEMEHEEIAGENSNYTS